MDTKSIFELLKKIDKESVAQLAKNSEGRLVVAVVAIIVILAGIYFEYDVTDILVILGQGL